MKEDEFIKIINLDEFLPMIRGGEKNNNDESNDNSNNNEANNNDNDESNNDSNNEENENNNRNKKEKESKEKENNNEEESKEVKVKEEESKKKEENKNEKGNKNEEKVKENEKEEKKEVYVFDEEDDREGEITVEETVVIKEQHQLYDNDKIYERDLENVLFSSLPYDKQGDKYYQEIIMDKIDSIMKLKKKGASKKINVLQNNYIQKIYNSPWLIPVVLDKKKIYKKEDLETNSQKDTLIGEELNKQIVYKKDDELIKEIKELRRSFVIQKRLSYTEYLNKLNTLLNPYVESLEDQSAIGGVGVNLNFQPRTQLLRFNGIDRKDWDYRFGNNGYSFDEVKLYNEERVYVVGLFYLPSIQTREYGERIGKIGDIESIEKGAILTITNHDLSKGDNIYIKGGPLEGAYEDINVIDNDKISLNVFIGPDIVEPYGVVYGEQKLEYGNEPLSFTGGQQLYLFGEKYSDDNTIRNIVPEDNVIIEKIKPSISNAIMIEEIEKETMKYFISFKDGNLVDLWSLKKILSDNIKRLALIEPIEIVKGEVDIQLEKITNMYRQYDIVREIVKYFSNGKDGDISVILKEVKKGQMELERKRDEIKTRMDKEVKRNEFFEQCKERGDSCIDDDIKKLKFSQISCIYKEKIGCISSKHYRNMLAYDEIIGEIEKGKELIYNLIVLEKLSETINVPIEEKKKKGKREKKMKKEINEEGKEEGVVVDDDKTIMDKIDLITNLFIKKSLIYKLINKDGLQIGNFIYSKKSGKEIICSHWRQLQLIENQNDYVKKQKLINNLIEVYAQDDNGVDNCKVCGNFIYYAEADLFGAYGYIPEADLQEDFQHKKLIDYSKMRESISCQSTELFDLLNLERKLTDVEIQFASKYCALLKTIVQRIGTLIKMEDVVDIILDVLGIKIDTFSKFKAKFEAKYPQRKDIKAQYEQFLNIRMSCIASVRLLIMFQTKIPQYKIGETVCPFNGFEGENGINYFACILMKMKIGKVKEEELKRQIGHYYGIFMSQFPKLKILFQQYENYKSTLIMEPIKYARSLSIDVPSTVDENDLIMMSLKYAKEFIIENNKELQSKGYSDVIKKIAISWNAIENKRLKGQLQRIKISNGAKNTLSGENMYEWRTRWEPLINPIVRRYCMIGKTRGEVHMLIDDKCIKCGEGIDGTKTKKQFDEFIEELNIKNMKKEAGLKKKSDDMDYITLKQESNKNLERIRSLFLESLDTICGEGKIKKEYKTFISSDDYGLTKKMTGMKEDDRLRFKIQLLKLMINSYFRKNFAVLKNYPSVDSLDIINQPQTNDKILNEKIKKLREQMLEYGEEIYKFLSPDTMKHLSKIDFKYSIDFVNKIEPIEGKINVHETITMLEYALYSQLLEFLRIEGIKKTLVVNIILRIIDLIIKDNTNIDMNQEEINKIVEVARYKEREAKLRKLEKNLELNKAKMETYGRLLDSDGIDFDESTSIGISGPDDQLSPGDMTVEAEETYSEEVGEDAGEEDESEYKKKKQQLAERDEPELEEEDRLDDGDDDYGEVGDKEREDVEDYEISS